MYNKLIRPIGIVLIDIQENKMYVNTHDRDVQAKLLANSFWEEKY
jgi:hypothetical protein